jgi:predicted amidohydrolase YtcJ
VQGDTIRAVGSRRAVTDALVHQGVEFVVDDRYADRVLLPGFVEAHCHAVQMGLFWQSPYLGRADRRAPDGRSVPGCTTMPHARDPLRTDTADGDGAILGWGYDPPSLDGQPFPTRVELDEVSTTRPVLVVNLSGHIFYANTVALDRAGYGPSTDIPGVVKDADGIPTGELHELPAAAPVFVASAELPTPDALKQAVWDAGRVAQHAGCTTISELAAGLSPGAVEAMADAAADADYPVRVSYYLLSNIAAESDEAVARVVEAQAENTEHFRLAGVKFVTDGSIQGFTANLEWPYYYDGHPNGLVLFTDDDLAAQVRRVHEAGVQCALHANGDAATTQVIDALERALDAHPRGDHRHRIEHNQMVTDAQLERMAGLGVATNLFVNHIHHWGDFHAAHTVGPDRVGHLNPLASARRRGVRFALHSDAWVTPLDPLAMIWTAATRLSREGHVYGPDERIPVDAAIRACTIDAAWLLGEDHLKGSLEVGKLADLVALDADPTEVAIDDIPTIEVTGTVLGGRPF